MELPNIAAYAYQDVHVWSALLTCLRPLPVVRRVILMPTPVKHPMLLFVANRHPGGGQG